MPAIIVPVGENHVATAKVWMTDDRTKTFNQQSGSKVMTIADHSIRISADRGGTFCDVYACVQPSMYTI